MILVVIKGASLDAGRSEGLLRLMTSLLRMLTNWGIEESYKYVFPLVNNANNFRNAEQIETAFQKTLDFLAKKLKIFNEAEALDETNPEYMEIKDQYSGVQYPNQEELAAAHYLMRVLKRNFRCVDPKDEGLDKF